MSLSTGTATRAFHPVETLPKIEQDRIELSDPNIFTIYGAAQDTLIPTQLVIFCMARLYVPRMTNQELADHLGYKTKNSACTLVKDASNDVRRALTAIGRDDLTTHPIFNYRHQTNPGKNRTFSFTPNTARFFPDTDTHTLAGIAQQSLGRKQFALLCVTSFYRMPWTQDQIISRIGYQGPVTIQKARQQACKNLRKQIIKRGWLHLLDHPVFQQPPHRVTKTPGYRHLVDDFTEAHQNGIDSHEALMLSQQLRHFTP